MWEFEWKYEIRNGENTLVNLWKTIRGIYIHEIIEFLVCFHWIFNTTARHAVKSKYLRRSSPFCFPFWNLSVKFWRKFSNKKLNFEFFFQYHAQKVTPKYNTKLLSIIYADEGKFPIGPMDWLTGTFKWKSSTLMQDEKKIQFPIWDIKIKIHV